MELANFKLKELAERGYTFTPFNPYTGEDFDDETTISVVGCDSAAYRNARTEALREAAKAGKEFTADELSILIYARCVTGWAGFENNGEVFEFSYENVVHLLTEHTFLLDQVANAIDSRVNFKLPAEKN